MSDAVQADQRLAASEQQVESAADSVKAARSLRLPTISAGGTYMRLDEPPAFNVDLAPLPLPKIQLPIISESFGAYRADVSLPLFTGGRINNTVKATQEALDAARDDAGRSAQDVRLSAAEAYTAVLRAMKLLALARGSVEALTAHEHDVADLQRSGLAAMNDVLAVRAELANASQDQIRVANALDLARAALNRLLGRELSAEVHLEDVQTAELDEPLESATDRALRERRELKALEHQSRALELQATATRGAALPQVGVSAGYNHITDQYLVREGFWSVMLGVKWDLFDGGLSRHQADALHAKARATEDLRRDAGSQIALQVRSAWLAERESKSRIGVAETGVEEAEENLRVSRDRYQSGVGTNTEVLDAQALRLRSQNNLANAIYDHVIAVLRLRHAAGEL